MKKMQKSKSYKTKIISSTEIKRDWYMIDATDKTLGRLSVDIATLLMGKNKVDWCSNLDCGDFVVVINAGKYKVTGKKKDQKTYFSHSGYPGGDRTQTLDQLDKTNPTKPIEHAVKGMLPKNKLGRSIIKKLYVYEDENHPHSAQNPKVFN